MLPKKFVTDEKAISNLIATLILIAVAVVGGAFAYTAFRGQAQSATTSADLQLQDLTVIRTGSDSNDVLASATLKNVGTQQLTGVRVIVGPPKGSSPTITLGDENPSADDNFKPMDPGVSSSSSQDEMDAAGSFDAGTTYAVKIKAETPDGGSITKTMTVRVKS